MFGRKSKRQSESDSANDSTSAIRTESDTRREPGTRRRPRRWPYFLLLLAVFVFFLPNLIGWLGLHQPILNYASSSAGFRGKINVENFSVGWMQPISIGGIRVDDESGQPLLHAESIVGSKPLYSLLSGNDYGSIQVNRPIAKVTMRPGGSNLEDALANLLNAKPGEQPEPTTVQRSALPKIQLTIVEGQALIGSESVPNRLWQIDSWNGTVQTSTEAAPLIIEMAARVTPQTIDAGGQPAFESSGAMTLVSHVDAGSNHLTFESMDVALETNRLPISVVGPLIERTLGPAIVDGSLSGKVQANYSAADQSMVVSTSPLNCQQISFECPALIEQDQITIQSVACDGDLKLTPRLISASEFELQSDVGNVRANGNFDLNELAQLGSSGRLMDSPFQMNGQFDLARVIKMLPSTLQLHQDLNVKSGTLTFNVNSQKDNRGRRLVFNMDTANLNASRGNQSIVWAKPLRLVGTIADNQGQISIEDVRCESEFLEIKGQGSLNLANFQARGDLQKLAQRVSQFVDLQGAEVAGLVDGKFGWQVMGNTESNAANLASNFHQKPIQIRGDFMLTQPLIAIPGIPRWQPNEVAVSLSGVGLTKNLPDQSTALQLDQGRIQMDIGTERAVATLTQPISDAFTADTWIADCQAVGELGRWLAHAKNFVDLGDLNAAGEMNFRSNVTIDPTQITFKQTDYLVNQFRMVGYGLKLNESSVKGSLGGSLGGRYDFATGVIELPEMSLAADSVSAAGRNLTIAYPSNLRIDGDVAFRANVNRVADWIELSPTSESVFWFGDADGNVKFASDENGIGMTIQSNITDLAAATQTTPESIAGGPVLPATQPQRQWTALWQERKVQIDGGLKLSNDFNGVALTNTRLQSPSINAIATGTIDDLAGSMTANLNGAWIPDWNKINNLLAEFTGESLRFSGTKQQNFSLRGPLFALPNTTDNPNAWVPSLLAASGNFGWESGEVLGLPVGQTEFVVNLNQSIATVSTTGIPFAGGAIQMQPTIDLSSENPILSLENTRIVNNVQLQPETARKWLKYVAPLAADSTSAQGNFSLDVNSASVPLMDPMRMQTSGSIHLNQVVIGTGPIADQLLASVKQLRQILKPGAEEKNVRTSMQLKDQTVPFMVRDGRVFHEKIEFSHNDLVIRTSGSVGFDQQLQMVASIPIADDWIDGEKYLAGLKGQSISIPIGGTVSKPQFDRTAIARFSQDLAKTAATQAAQQAIAEKLTPKLGEYQQKFNNKVSGELNKFQNKLQEGFNKKLGLEKLGLGGSAESGINKLIPNLIPGQSETAPAGTNSPSNAVPANSVPDPKELLQGIGNLFKK